jgi:DNA mismatch endonuclease (patch repair protein)
VTDVHTTEQRSRNMAAIRSKNTKPEMIVRRLLWEMGLRYRLHRKDLPGKPDIVLPGRRIVIFVHGCFFHMHKCRYGLVVPATNAEFWQTKRRGNADRDRRNIQQLRKQGWKVFVVWECCTKSRERLRHRLQMILKSVSSSSSPL